MSNYSHKIDDAWQILRIQGEFVKGFDQLSQLGNAVSIFGSARTSTDNEYYKMAKETASIFSSNGYGVITGGGPGIMEAGNLGAYEKDHSSIGLQIRLPFEASANPYIDELVECRYFFTRKVFFLKYSQAFIAFPGGFGTLDELFEVLTLIQTEHMRKVPVVLMGSSYWSGLIDWIKHTMLLKEQNINESDLDLFKIIDSPNEAYQYIHERLKLDDTNF